jgi:hypothetical protein
VRQFPATFDGIVLEVCGWRAVRFVFRVLVIGIADLEAQRFEGATEGIIDQAIEVDACLLQRDVGLLGRRDAVAIVVDADRSPDVTPALDVRGADAQAIGTREGVGQLAGTG